MAGGRKKTKIARRKNEGAQASQPTESSQNATAIPTTTTNGVPGRNSAKEQYQHYIPRFILRNFALDDHLKHSKERHEINLYSLNDKLLRIADVDKSYGVFNMYADIQNKTNLQFVEVELSHLEQRVSGILTKILDPSKFQITMTRSELTSLKKFFFIMSFHYPTRRRQYTENRFSAGGLKIQQEFMRARDRRSIDDVWLETIKGILLDDEETTLPLPFDLSSNPSTSIGPMENIDYKLQGMSTFVCIWEAEEPCEFVLTDNSFGVFEGNCGRAFAGSAYHYFYPVSPRRIIVQSSVTFKQNDPGFATIFRQARRDMLGISPEQSWFPQEIHIPPVPNYPESLQRILERIDQGRGEDARPFQMDPRMQKDLQEAFSHATYTYSVVKIKKEEVDKVNSCLLNEMTDSLTFRSCAQMARTLRQWRKHVREIGWGPNIFPPNFMPSFEQPMFSSLDQYMSETFANLDIDELLRPPTMYDELEEQLKEELNRTHQGRDIQNGEVRKRSQGCWKLEVSSQPAKLSWRRVGRVKTSSGTSPSTI